MDRESSVLMQKSMAAQLLQNFVKIDGSFDFVRTPALRDDATTARSLREQSEKVTCDIADHQQVLDAARSRFEAAKADLEAAQAVAAKLAEESCTVTREHEQIEEREFKRSAALRRAQSQTSKNFEYHSQGEASDAGASSHHSLHAAFRHFDKSVGSKDWKALADLADPEKLRATQAHRFPCNAEAEIGPAGGPSLVEPLLSASAILEKIDCLQEESSAYIESSISFKHCSTAEDAALIIARRRQFRAYIELEKDNCYGPFGHIRRWLQDRQKSTRNVAALFVRREETHHTKPGVNTQSEILVGSGEGYNVPYSFRLHGIGALYLHDEDAQGEMVSLQVKREYSSRVTG